MKSLTCFTKKIICFGAVALLLTISVQLSIPNAAPAGKLIVEPSSFDCGVVEEGAFAVMLVTIENSGDDKADIKNVRTN